ncbi:MAG TPA: sugar phosphate nucleotidyltransferase, partial [Micromonosporaceae bacterium]
MGRDLCAVLLAAGEGTRLRPLTTVLPKALCPVGNVALVDRARAACATLGLAGAKTVAVNAWAHADAMVAHFKPDDAYVSVESGPHPLGSAGGLAALRQWIDGRDVVVGNADAYLTGGSVIGLTEGWTGDRVRMLATRADRPALGDFGRHRFAGFTVIPWRWIASLDPDEPDLVRSVWRPAEAAGELQIVEFEGRYLDCGTPADYLAANLDVAARHGGSLVAAEAQVSGIVEASVIGAGARVAGSV